MHMDAAGGEFAGFADRGVLAGAQLDQLAAIGKPGQRAFEVGPRFAFGAQLPHQLFEIGPAVRQAGDVRQQSAVGHTPIVNDGR